MIHEYPKCTYHGCDISDTRYKKVNVEKFIYTYGNVVKGLPYEDNSFDFVHMRLLVLALREEEWPTAISELIRVTKPGGMIQLLEMDLRQQVIVHKLILCICTINRELFSSKRMIPLVHSIELDRPVGYNA